MKKLILIATTAALSAPAFAGKYIVLFKKTAEASTVGEDRAQEELMNVNNSNVQILNNWMNTAHAWDATEDVNAKDYWIAQAALVDIQEARVDDLRKQPFVNRVIPDITREYLGTAGDQMKILGDGTSVDEMNFWGLDSIHLKEARAQFPNLTGAGVRVGTLDTGVQTNHPEFASIARPVVFKDFVNHLPNPYDDLGHGSHVFGTIAGVNTGIAPKVSMVIAKGFNALGVAPMSRLLEAMQWLADPDGNPQTKDYPRIINNSWGNQVNRSEDISFWLPYERVVESWIAMGIIPVFAAGNAGGDFFGVPGGFSEALAVGAYQADNSIADFSSRGPVHWIRDKFVQSVFKPDLSAPGVDITSAYPGNKYATMKGGTSFATPHVTGALALAMQANPNLNFKTAKIAILNSVQQKQDLSYGAGTLDLPKLLREVSKK